MVLSPVSSSLQRSHSASLPLKCHTHTHTTAALNGTRPGLEPFTVTSLEKPRECTVDGDGLEDDG